MMQGRTVTKAQKHWHDLLCRVVGCIACRIGRKTFNDYCSIHHIDGRTKPHAHWYVLPLCELHHQHGGEGVALHHNKARFEQNFGKQDDLLAECAKIIANEGRDIPAGFLAWLDGSEVEA